MLEDYLKHIQGTTGLYEIRVQQGGVTYFEYFASLMKKN